VPEEESEDNEDDEEHEEEKEEEESDYDVEEEEKELNQGPTAKPAKKFTVFIYFTYNMKFLEIKFKIYILAGSVCRIQV